MPGVVLHARPDNSIARIAEDDAKPRTPAGWSVPWLTRAAAGVALIDLALIALLLWPDAVGEAARQPLRIGAALLTVGLSVALLMLLRRLRDALARAEAAVGRERVLFDAVPASLSLWSSDGRLLDFNPQFRALHERPGHPLTLGMTLESLLRAAVDGGDVPAAKGREPAWLAERLRRFGTPGEPQVRQRPDGRWRRLTEIRLPDGNVLGHSVEVTEVVEQGRALDAARREAVQQRQRLEDAFDAVPAALELYDTDDRLVLSNLAMQELFPRLCDLYPSRPTWEQLVRANFELGGLAIEPSRFEGWLAERRALRRSGGPGGLTLIQGRWFRRVERTTREGGMIGARIDVTELVRRESELQRVNAELDAANAELRRLADTDALTGIANRRRFEQTLTEAWSRGGALALLMIDIDHFKRFNDHHGHPAGDACLRRVAAVLTAVLRGPSDLAARLGGEEFAVLLPGEGAAGARAAAQRCLDLLADAAIAHDDSPLGDHVSFSIGIAVRRTQDASAQALIDGADAALYDAKRAGRARYELHAAA